MPSRPASTPASVAAVASATAVVESVGDPALQAPQRLEGLLALGSLASVVGPPVAVEPKLADRGMWILWFTRRFPAATAGAGSSRDTHDRVREDRVSKTGNVTLRHNGRLHHIGLGRTHAGTYIRLLVEDLQITVADATTGEVFRELVPGEPTRDYQPTRRPRQTTVSRTYIP